MKANSFLLFAFYTFLIGCKPGAEIKPQSQTYEIAVPSNLATSIPQPTSNTASLKGIELGRKLFYDPILSGNNKISCASCHVQKNSFTDNGVRFSIGESLKPLLRHTMPLFNLAWANGYFWDGGAKNLESQVFAPLQNPDEMNQDLNVLLNELKNNSSYTSLFNEAFGSDSINSAKIAQAIAQFERTLISANSKYDYSIRKEKGIELDTLELHGLAIFNAKCANCHKPNFFTDFGYHNNGLDSSFTDDSHENLYKGRYRITENINDIGKYKTPSLRNIALTAPYMHDGRFATLEEVINHYSEGITKSPTLDLSLQNGFKFNSSEKDALISFLNTLTDYEFITNSEFSAP